MPTDPGRRVGIAFRAVVQCHQDVGRLIADFDGYMTNTGMSRMWNQDSVTANVSRAGYAPYWMASRLYRMYHRAESEPNVVEGLNIRFFTDKQDLAEPRLTVGKIGYAAPTNYTWDLDDGYSKWCNASVDDYGKLVSCVNADNSRVLRMSVLACDLYSIKSLEDIKFMLEQAREHFEVVKHV